MIYAADPGDIIFDKLQQNINNIVRLPGKPQADTDTDHYRQSKNDHKSQKGSDILQHKTSCNRLPAQAVRPSALFLIQAYTPLPTLS